MPGSVLPNMSIVLPSLGGDAGTWDDILNDALGIVDAHDHTSGKGPRVPTAGININADLSFGGFTATNVGKIGFSTIAAPSSGSKNLFVNTADNELYWRTNGGTNVKLTNGTSINTTLVGGIVGDYTAVGAALAYDDANDRYTFKQQAPGNWARLASGPVRIFEFNTTESVFVELAVAGALGSSYTVTLPAALPGSTSLMQIDSSGNVAFSRTPTVDSLTVTTGGNLTLNGTATLTTNGTNTFNGGTTATTITGTTITASTNYKHSFTKVLHIPACMAAAGGATPTLDTNAERWTLGTSALIVTFPFPLQDGDRITGWTLYIHKTTDNTKTITAQLRKINTSGGATTLSNQGSAVTNNANNPGGTTMSASGLTVDVAAADSYHLHVNGSGTTGDLINHLEIQYTRP